MISEPDDLSEGSEEENILCPSDQTQIHRETQNKRSIQDNQGVDDEEHLNNSATDERRNKYIKSIKIEKPNTCNSAQQLAEILKEHSVRKKRQCEEKCNRQEHTTTNLFENLDDMDMFFLSMSRMTKQLPKFEQAKIKLALSNLVLSAEIRCNQEPSYPTQQQIFVSTNSPALQTMSSVSSHSSAPSTSSMSLPNQTSVD